MAVITRVLAVASVLSLALVSTAPAAVGAVSVDRLGNRSAHTAHAALVKKSSSGSNVTTKNGKRCKVRSPASSSKAPAATSKAASATHKPASTKAASAPAQTTKAAQNNGGSSGSSSSGSSSSGGAVGRPKNAKWLAWSNGEDDQLKYYSGIGGIYSWGPTVPSQAKSLGLEGASMLWGYKSLDQFRKVRDQYDYLMGMNEVNLGSQSQMSVSEGIKLWNDEIRIYAGKKYLVAPSVTTAADGFDWLDGFFDGCGGTKGCDVDAMSAHVYSKTAQGVIDYCTKLHERYNKPVWLSEFACQSFGGSDTGGCNSDQAYAFMAGVLDWAEKTDWMHMYSPYGAMQDLGNVSPANSLMASSGKPSGLGYYFLQN